MYVLCAHAFGMYGSAALICGCGIYVHIHLSYSTLHLSCIILLSVHICASHRFSVHASSYASCHVLLRAPCSSGLRACSRRVPALLAFCQYPFAAMLVRMRVSCSSDRLIHYTALFHASVPAHSGSAEHGGQLYREET